MSKAVQPVDDDDRKPSRVPKKKLKGFAAEQARAADTIPEILDSNEDRAEQEEGTAVGKGKKKRPKGRRENKGKSIKSRTNSRLTDVTNPGLDTCVLV